MADVKGEGVPNNWTIVRKGTLTLSFHMADRNMENARVRRGTEVSRRGVELNQFR